MKDIEDAQKRRTLFSSREDYKQQRLEKIMKMKETESPSLEELQAKPGIKEIRQTKLVHRDDTISAARSKDDYI